MKNFIRLSGFVLIAIGTIGLLLNEFFLDGTGTISHNRTIIFAIVTFVGFTNLAFAHFGMKGKT